MRLLVEGSARVDQMTKIGRTALMEASWHGKLEVVCLLLDMGASVDLCPKKLGYSALLYTSQQGHLEVVRALLEGGADVNLQDAFSALEYACQENHLKVASLFLENGANMKLKHHHGRTAMSYAKSFEMQLLLEDYISYDRR